VLFKGHFRTALTYRANVDRIYFGSADWVALCVKRIRRFLFTPGPRSEAPMLRAPANRTFLAYGLRQVVRISKVSCAAPASQTPGTSATPAARGDR
jgi:hypothetical protein